ncbi:hypothetical protein HYALB_00003581 [Hymenoscyphus albidus]|uniref:Enolase-phosphatase E1 n=1 Tax=Hymenoscyphus albidus TaxID=595503 RepID=A0A9N9M2P8_9HELO|nr:hypothetical protein HYALB_00003581 [Hymenoscyphus albidus]
MTARHCGVVTIPKVFSQSCSVTIYKPVISQFPYALTVLPKVLETEWDSPTLAPYISAFPVEHQATPAALLSHVHHLMSQDLKIAYLKSLQGYLWTQGYLSGSLLCTLFPDVTPALRKWHAAGLTLIIYSSGSVAAQKLLFQYTTDGDLRPLIEGYFDTVNAGLKQERGSYERIVGTRREGVEKWLFLSDNVGEVSAAREAGLQSFVVVREGNGVLGEEEREGQVLVGSFEEIEIGGV